MLDDLDDIAIKAVGFAVGLGLVVGLIALILRSMMESSTGSGMARMLTAVGALAAWILVTILFLTNGNRGFYGDRLFVILKDQAELSGIRQITDIDEQRTAAYQMLVQLANETQAGLRNTLDRSGVEYTPYYLVNAIEVRGGTLVRLYLATRPEVDRVIPSPRLRPTGSANVPPQSIGEFRTKRSAVERVHDRRRQGLGGVWRARRRSRDWAVRQWRGCKSS